MLFMVTNEADLRLELMNYSSLNQAFALFDDTSAFFSWANNIDLFYLWQIMLAAIGLHCWSQFSLAKSVVLAAIPYIVIFSIMLLSI